MDPSQYRIRRRKRNQNQHCMSKAILTYQPYIEIVSHSCHPNRIELMILVIQVATISFIVVNFAAYEKVLIK